MARRGRRFYRQAELDALVRFNPEMSGLLELQRQAQQNLHQGVRSARGNAAGIMAAVDRQRPQVAKIYDDATEAQGHAAAMVASQGATGIIGQAIGGEAANAQARLAEARAADLAALSARKVQAREGRQFQVQQARSTFAEEIGQVLRRKQSLRAEMGAFTAQTAGNLRSDAAQRRQEMRIATGKMRLDRSKLRQDERKSIRSSGIDPDTGRPIPGGKLDLDANGKPGGSKRGSGGTKGPDPLTKGQQATAADQVGQALALARKAAKTGAPIEVARANLLAGDPGRKSEPVYDPVTGKKKIDPKTGLAVTSPGRPAQKPWSGSDLLLAAALEEAYLGHVTKKTQRRLRQRGLRIGHLGLTPYVGTRYTPSGPGSDAAQR